MPIVLAESEGTSWLLLLLALGGLGHWLVRSVERLRQRQKKIIGTACVFAVVTGLFAASVIFGKQQSDSLPDELFGRVFFGTVVGCISFLGWYFAAAVVFFAWQYVFAVPFRALSAWRHAARGRHEAARYQYQSAVNGRREQEDRTLEEQRKLERQEHQQSDRRRRENARFTCQMLYDRHRKTLSDRFPSSSYRRTLPNISRTNTQSTTSNSERNNSSSCSWV